MTEDPLVSVVIPCFNHAHFLPQAIDSVRRQSYPAIELIVVDDGSSDDTAAMARRLGADRVIRQPNRGLSAARNTGLAAARGDLVICLDADDELIDDAVASGVAALRRRPDAAVIAAYCLLIDEDGHALPSNPPEVDGTDVYAELLRRNFIWTPGAAIFRRAALLRVGGFPVDVSPAADYAVYLAFAREGRLVVDSRVAVRYRQHGANMSRDGAAMLRAALTVLRRERRHLTPGYRRPFKAGWRDWSAYYGEQIVEQLRFEWRADRRPRVLVAGARVLLRHCHHTFLTHAARKLGRMMRGLPPTPLEAGRFTSSRGTRHVRG
jgi:glycosyltransferase involved in cell wall biosynthesis